jgi:thermitase
MSAGLPPNITAANQEWIIDFCNARTAWNSTMGAGIVIAHPDTGVTAHPELSNNFQKSKGKNFYHSRKWGSNRRPKTDIEDKAKSSVPYFFSHGTSTGSVLSSTRGNLTTTNPTPGDTFPEKTPQAYVSGVAPEATVIPFLITESVLLFNSAVLALVNTIDHCIGLNHSDHPEPVDVAVMSISLGYPLALPGLAYQYALVNALKRARAHGLVVCAAAGQSGDHELPVGLSPIYPGSSIYTICCAACDENMNELSSGFYGSEVDITAPGINTWHAKATKPTTDTGPATGFEVWNSGAGTSYSTAVVAGACALWQAHHGRNFLIGRYSRGLLTDAFRHCLKASATVPSGWPSNRRGAGVLDIDALLNLTLPAKSTIEAESQALEALFA